MTPPEQNKVPTPRTEEAITQCAQGGEFEVDIVFADFARTLERELAEAKEQVKQYETRLVISPQGDDRIDELEGCIKHLRHQLSLLTKPIEPEALRKAVERSEYVIAHTNKHYTFLAAEFFLSDIQTLLLAVRQGEGMRGAMGNTCSILRAVRKSMDSQLPFPSLEKISEAIERYEEALNQLKTGGDGE